MNLNKSNIITKFLISIIFLLILIDGLGLIFNLNDIFYLNKILDEELISEVEHNFYETKSLFEYWITTTSSIFFVIILSIWYYQNYKEIYNKNKDQAPYKTSTAGFSFIIPIFQFFGPYKIMKFIWWGNKDSESDVSYGYRLIKIWWVSYIVVFLLARFSQIKMNNAEYADEYLTITFIYILYSIISIFSSIILYKIVTRIKTTTNN
jgi:hypothetical protein